MMDIDIKLNKISQLFDKIDSNFKNCKIKYRNKNDIDSLYKNLTVNLVLVYSFFFLFKIIKINPFL